MVDYFDITCNAVDSTSIFFRISKDKFKWEDIKYDMIPFLSLLSEKFTIIKPYKSTGIKFDKKADIVFCTSKYEIKYTIKSLIDEQDNGLNNIELSSIKIYIGK